MIINLSSAYAESYTQGYQARQGELCVNPYVLDMDATDKYQGWQDGWRDADLDIEVASH